MTGGRAVAGNPYFAPDAPEGDVARTSDATRQWPTARSMPLARPGLSAVPLDENVAIYDEIGQVLVMLNQSASAVLERCDGATTFEKIVSDLAQHHSEDVDTVREDVWHTLRKLASIGLVAEAL
jgi:hypothetical protein